MRAIRKANRSLVALLSSTLMVSAALTIYPFASRVEVRAAASPTLFGTCCSPSGTIHSELQEDGLGNVEGRTIVKLACAKTGDTGCKFKVLSLYKRKQFGTVLQSTASTNFLTRDCGTSDMGWEVAFTQPMILGEFTYELVSGLFSVDCNGDDTDFIENDVATFDNE